MPCSLIHPHRDLQEIQCHPITQAPLSVICVKGLSLGLLRLHVTLQTCQMVCSVLDNHKKLLEKPQFMQEFQVLGMCLHILNFQL